jgi:hypothetical protein
MAPITDSGAVSVDTPGIQRPYSTSFIMLIIFNCKSDEAPKATIHMCSGANDS